MLRWLGIILAIGLVSTSADAQVFKPKSKKAAATEKKAAPQKKAAKKQPRAGATKKRPAKKKSKASDRGSSDDLTSESESKGAGKDYVKIWDDDEIE
jgi:hypothetical protein